jgi:hypothetical protein
VGRRAEANFAYLLNLEAPVSSTECRLGYASQSTVSKTDQGATIRSLDPRPFIVTSCKTLNAGLFIGATPSVNYRWPEDIINI